MFPAYSSPIDFDVIVRLIYFEIPDMWEVTVKVGDNWRSRKFSTTVKHSDSDIRAIAMEVAAEILKQFDKDSS